MDIHDFPYIKIDNPVNGLISQIENFYILNNKVNTLEHVRTVAKTNIKISEQYNLDKDKCFLAGLLHDISAVMQPNDMTVYAKAYGIELDESELMYPFLLHQQISRAFAETIFGIDDINILSAIECHTTLKANPSEYDMSLFIADKLSWDQEGKPPFYENVKAALSTSLESACLQYITYMIENDLILLPHKWFLESKAFLENHVT